MLSKIESEYASTLSSDKSDLAVQAINSEKTVPVDGSIIKTTDSSSEVPTSPSDIDTTSVSVEPSLDSPFHSPRPAAEDGMSDTTLESGEIPDDMLESTAEIKGSSVGDEHDFIALKDVKETKETKNSEGGSPGEFEPKKENKAAAMTIEDPEKAEKCIAAPESLDKGLNAALDSTEDEVVEDQSDHRDASKDIICATSLSHTATDVDNDVAATEGEGIVVEAPKESQSAQSIPSHMRPDYQSPTSSQPGIQRSRYSTTTPTSPRYADFPRAPRQQYAQNTYQTYRSDGDRGEVARMSAQLMKTRNELDVERKKRVNMRTTVEIEKQQEMDAALASMTTDLLRKQAEALASKAKFKAKERDLAYREARIEQLEVYLSEGQKQVYHQDDGELGERTMADVNREHNRRQAELKAQKLTADMESKLAQRIQHLQLREAAQQMREQQYKALMRTTFEAKMEGRNMPEIEAKTAEVANLEYNRGFGAGKEVGCKQGEEEAREKGFLEGYGACHRTEVALSKLRQGLIPRDSPELDFIYDAAHPHNIFTMGTRIGEWERKKEVEKAKGQVMSGSKKVEHMIQKKEELIIQKKVEEPVRKLHPPRPTFASELRGAQTMHNGHIVLTNGSAPSSPAAILGNKGVNGGGVADCIDESFYEGRRILKYEAAEADNLIDLH